MNKIDEMETLYFDERKDKTLLYDAKHSVIREEHISLIAETGGTYLSKIKF